MKTNNFANVFESVNNVMNDTKKERRAWHSEEQKLSRLLHVCQEKRMQKFSYPLFEKVGIPTNGKVKVSEYLSLVVNFVTVKGEEYPAYIREITVYERDSEGKIKKDKDGAYIPQKDKEGNIVKDFKLTPIKEGTWTLEKLLKAVIK